jgi:DNA polymerase I-like protein with 3'-5' exonuclease and polymerase domains
MPSRVPKFKTPAEFDHLMLEPVHWMMRKGIKIDPEEESRLRETAIKEWAQQQHILDRVVGMKEGEHLNVESKKLIPYLLYDHLKLPKRTKKGKVRADEAALRDLMAYCRSKFESLKSESAKVPYMTGYMVCRQIINIRRRRKQLSSFLGVHVKHGSIHSGSQLKDPDGRVRSTVSVGGTKTGRFSHSKTLWDTGLNLATVPMSLRSMFVPDEGFELAEFDLNRGESWIYAHLSEDPELLRIHTEGLDFHAETAAAISVAFDPQPRTVEWIIENKDGEAFRLRYLGKRVNHASAYRMRAFKGAEVVNKEADETGVTVTVAEFNKAHEIWLRKYWGVPGKWWPEIEKTLEKTRTLVTPFGRKMVFHDRWGEKLFRDATAYVPQSTAVDYINRGFLEVHYEFVKTGAWGLSVLAQTHDSILVQYRSECRDEAIPSIAETLGKLELTIKGRTFKIPIEASFGPNWRDLEAYRLR